MASQDVDEVDVAILAALLDRSTEGMTIFELRNRVSADIDTIEAALERLKAEDLIETERTDERVVIRPTAAARAVVDADSPGSWTDRIREHLPF